MKSDQIKSHWKFKFIRKLCLKFAVIQVFCYVPTLSNNSLRRKITLEKLLPEHNIKNMEGCRIIDTKNACRKIKSSNPILHSLLPPNHERLMCDFFIYCLKQIANEGNELRRMQYSVVLLQGDNWQIMTAAFLINNPKDEKNNTA